MELQINDGMLHVRAGDVALLISPRRSLAVGHTTAHLTAAGLPPLRLDVEPASDDPSRWLWRGDTPGALQLARMAIAALLRRFAEGPSTEPSWPTAFRRAFAPGAGCQGACEAKATPSP